MPKFTAIEPVKHDGRRHEPGSALEMTQAHAAPLLALGAIEPERKPQVKPATEKAEAEAQTAAQGTLG